MSDWPYRYFTPGEMACKVTGDCKMDPAFMLRLERLRERYGKPLSVTSGYRSPSHPSELRKGGSTSGAHTRGMAVDLAVSGADAVRLVALAIELGFTGIGVAQKGEGRFIHVDTAPDSPGQPRPHMWSY